MIVHTFSREELAVIERARARLALTSARFSDSPSPIFGALPGLSDRNAVTFPPMALCPGHTSTRSG